QGAGGVVAPCGARALRGLLPAASRGCREASRELEREVVVARGLVAERTHERRALALRARALVLVEREACQYQLKPTPMSPAWICSFRPSYVPLPRRSWISTEKRGVARTSYPTAPMSAPPSATGSLTT